MKIGVFGYGNLGRAVEIMCIDRDGTELVGIFTRRPIESIKSIFAPVYNESTLSHFKDKIDVVLVCTGSASDTPSITPTLAGSFSTVDSYDNHKRLSEYKERVDAEAKNCGNVSIIAAGWDPGFLSILRLYSSGFMPYACENTFWGEGVSQGHSEALRSIDGVIDAVQFTVPIQTSLALSRVTKRRFKNEEKHKRVCYIVAETEKEGGIVRHIKSMTDYFGGYDTEVNFVSSEELERIKRTHSHRGRVISYGLSGLYRENAHTLECDLKISSNPEFTAGIMLSCADVAYKMKTEGYRGAFTLFDIPPSYFAFNEGYYDLL